MDGLQVRLGQVEGDEIRPLAGFERADVRLVERGGAAARGEVQRGLRRELERVAPLHFLQERGEMHVAEEVLRVVGRGAVRADGHGDAAREHLRDRGDAGGQLHVGGGVVDDRAAARRDDVEVGVVRVHHVEERRVVPQDAQRAAVLGRAQPVRGEARLGFADGLGEVEAEAEAEFVGQRAAAPEQAGVRGVDGVGRDGAADARMVLPLAGVAADAVEVRRLVGGGESGVELRDVFAQDGAQARFVDGGEDGVLEHVHVEERGAAGTEEFGAGEERRRADDLGR